MLEAVFLQFQIIENDPMIILDDYLYQLLSRLKFFANQLIGICSGEQALVNAT